MTRKVVHDIPVSGVVTVPITAPPYTTEVQFASATSSATLVPATPNKKIRVLSYIIGVTASATAGSVEFASGTQTRAFHPVAASATLNLVASHVPHGLFETAAGAALNLTFTNISSGRVTISYILI